MLFGLLFCILHGEWLSHVVIGSGPCPHLRGVSPILGGLAAIKESEARKWQLDCHCSEGTLPPPLICSASPHSPLFSRETEGIRFPCTWILSKDRRSFLRYYLQTGISAALSTFLRSLISQLQGIPTRQEVQRENGGWVFLTILGWRRHTRNRWGTWWNRAGPVEHVTHGVVEHVRGLVGGW